jgi:hypothetical protein
VCKATSGFRRIRLFRLTRFVRKRLEWTSQAPTDRRRLNGNYAVMKILSLIHVMAAQAFYRWAMREINPLHPDLPRIMLRQQELSDKARRMFAVSSFSR